MNGAIIKEKKNEGGKYGKKFRFIVWKLEEKKGYKKVGRGGER